MTADVRYHFVIEEPDPVRLAELMSVHIDDRPDVFTRGDLEWCLQTYLMLKGVRNVSCSTALDADAVNIVHAAQLRQMVGRREHFLVCVQADYRSCPWAHYTIVQNQRQLGPNRSLVPLWPQPGLIGRDPGRNGVKHVAYAGQPYNGNLAGDVDQWRRLFEPAGLEFSVLQSGHCHDLHDVDVLLAIRSFDHRTYDGKPPSKLANAWMAGIPLIGGHDSAFRQVGVPGEDYLLADSPAEVMKAVQRLRDDPELYQSIVNRGRAKAGQFTRDKIVHEWCQILDGPVVQRLADWQAHRTREALRRAAILSWELPITRLRASARSILRRR